VAVAEIVAGLVEVGLQAVLSAFRSKRKAPPQPLPTDPTKLQLFGLIVGSMLILASFAGYAVHLYQWQQENNVLTHSPARATIVSAAPKQAGGHRVTDARLDYVRQAAAGAVKCNNAQIRFRGWSGDFDVGKAVDVYPQGINCHGPIYAPDIGNPRTTLLVSLIAFSFGTALFTASYWVFRRRREAQAAISRQIGATTPSTG
jgi:hypothetical protein